MQDRQDRGRKQHADRGHGHERAEQEEIGGLAWVGGQGEGKRGPAHTVKKLAGREVAAPLVEGGGIARLLLELPRQREQDAFGDENRCEPQQNLARIGPVQHGHREHDGEDRHRQRAGRLVAHEHAEEIVFEGALRGRACRMVLPVRRTALWRAALPRKTGDPVQRAYGTHRPDFHCAKGNTRTHPCRQGR